LSDPINEDRGPALPVERDDNGSPAPAPRVEREDNGSKRRYVIHRPEGEAELSLSVMSPTKVIADHTYVPDALRGQGLAEELLQALLEDARAQWEVADAAYRTEARQYPGSTMCSAFRTFQGWTALSEMRNDQGVLHTVPIPKAMAYMMLRPLLSDIPEDNMCGVKPNRTFPMTKKWHGILTEAVSPIPDVQPGDSVWWHCDMIHSVAPVKDQQGWGNVMYIPAAPWCSKNESYAGVVREAFLSGRSPSDFPQEDYEASWPNRFSLAQLNEIGRRGLGLV